MPFDKSKYPPEWKAFSLEIRTERAKGRCECAGECGISHECEYSGDNRCIAQNGETGKIGKDGIWRSTNDIHSLQSDYGMARYPDFDFIGSKVVLTVAHLDNEGGICKCKVDTGMKCVIPEHCKAMCQSCHLRLDHPHHIANAQKTRARKNDENRGLLNL